jgi:peptidoglycan/LPS O-acetylase OafA/YrhL
MTPGGLYELLSGEVLLAAAAAVLVFATLAVVVERARWPWQIVLLVLAWLLWTAIVIVFGPAPQTGYGAGISYMAMLPLGVLLFALLLIALIRLVNQKQRVLPLIGAGVVAGVLFLLPYALWATNGIPRYLLAAIFAAVLVAACAAAGARFVAGYARR